MLMLPMLMKRAKELCSSLSIDSELWLPCVRRAALLELMEGSHGIVYQRTVNYLKASPGIEYSSSVGERSLENNRT